MDTRRSFALAGAALVVLLLLAAAAVFLQRATREDAVPASPVDPDAPSLARAELALEDDPSETRRELAVLSALLEELVVDAARIEPDADDGELVLRGSVPSARVRERALAIAREVADGVTVRDALRVRPPTPDPGRALAAWREAGAAVAPRLLAPRAELAVIRALGAEGLRVQASAEGATVRLAGEVPSDAARAVALAAAAETAGVAAVDPALEVVAFSPIAAACALALDVVPPQVPADEIEPAFPEPQDAAPSP